jgi:hypothetical protein
MIPPLAREQQDFQPATLTELCATLLKIVAIAAFVFGVIFGSKQWILVAAVSGTLSIAAYVYSQSSSDENWGDWIQRVFFNIRRSPHHLIPSSPLRFEGLRKTPHSLRKTRSFSPMGTNRSNDSLFSVAEQGDAAKTPLPVKRRLIYTPGDGSNASNDSNTF